MKEEIIKERLKQRDDIRHAWMNKRQEAREECGDKNERGMNIGKKKKKEIWRKRGDNGE